QSKEIGLIFDSQSFSIEIHTLLSQNIPNEISVVCYEEKLENSPVFDGERIVEEQFVYENPGEIIIDNEDDGFQIIEEKTRWQFLQSLFQPEETTVEFPRSFIGFVFEKCETWTYFSYRSFFGLYSKTAYIISGGNGQNKVRWSVDIPEDGEYDLYYYTYYVDYQKIPSVFKKRYPHIENATGISDYNFLVYHDKGTEKIKREISDYNQNDGKHVEVRLGTYYFSKGPAKIELTDETNGLYVFADAVKWVKKD
ncbi:hypothetical protein ACFL6H_10190, partial [Candidatus Latescibacterota bacterium]